MKIVIPMFNLNSLLDYMLGIWHDLLRKSCKTYLLLGATLILIWCVCTYLYTSKLMGRIEEEVNAKSFLFNMRKLRTSSFLSLSPPVLEAKLEKIRLVLYLCMYKKLQYMKTWVHFFFNSGLYLACMSHDCDAFGSRIEKSRTFINFSHLR